MRTNIEIDEKLMKATLRATGAKTKREAVELAMKGIVRMQAQEKALESLWGAAPDWKFDYKKGRE